MDVLGGENRKLWWGEDVPALAKRRYLPRFIRQVEPCGCEFEHQSLFPSFLQVRVHHKRCAILEGDHVLQLVRTSVNHL